MRKRVEQVLFYNQSECECLFLKERIHFMTRKLLKWTSFGILFLKCWLRMQN